MEHNWEIIIMTSMRICETISDVFNVQVMSYSSNYAQAALINNIIIL
jgi:hypothetical protein